MNNIIIDCRYLYAPNTGLERYTKNFLNTLDYEKNQNLEFTFFLKKKIFKKQSVNFDGLKTLKNFEKSFSFTLFCLWKYLLNLFKRKKTKIISLHFNYPFWLPIPGLCIIHDITPILYSNYFNKYKILKKLYFKFYIQLISRKKSIKVVTISKYNIKKLVKVYNFCYSPKLIHSGLDIDYYKNLKSKIKDKSPFNYNYILYVGDRRPHKNLERMIHIFLLLKKNHSYKGKFLIVGNKKKFDYQIPFDDSIIEIGEIDDSYLANLYFYSDALFFISLFEGYGLPVLESLFYNTKAIVNKDSACAEILNNYLLKLDLSQTNFMIALKINDFINSKKQINNFVIDKFNFSISTQKIIEHLINKNDII